MRGETFVAERRKGGANRVEKNETRARRFTPCRLAPPNSRLATKWHVRGTSSLTAV